MQTSVCFITVAREIKGLQKRRLEWKSISLQGLGGINILRTRHNVTFYYSYIDCLVKFGLLRDGINQ
jgi:hypothetical protein